MWGYLLGLLWLLVIILCDFLIFVHFICLFLFSLILLLRIWRFLKCLVSGIIWGLFSWNQGFLCKETLIIEEDYAWNPSTFACECDKNCDISEYLKDYTFTKGLVKWIKGLQNELVVACDEVIGTPEIIPIESVIKKDYYLPYTIFLATILLSVHKTAITDTMPNIILISYWYCDGWIERNQYQIPWTLIFWWYNKY